MLVCVLGYDGGDFDYGGELVFLVGEVVGGVVVYGGVLGWGELLIIFWVGFRREGGGGVDLGVEVGGGGGDFVGVVVVGGWWVRLGGYGDGEGGGGFLGVLLGGVGWVEFYCVVGEELFLEGLEVGVEDGGGWVELVGDDYWVWLFVDGGVDKEGLGWGLLMRE